MIEFTSTHLRLSQAVCKALIAFSSKDKTRANIYGVGINQGNICATDGHAGVRFQKHTGTHEPYQADRVFPLDYVNQQLKIAAVRGDAVELDWNNLNAQMFPPLHAVESKNRKIHMPAATPVGFNAELLGRMFLVQVACSPTQARKSSAKGFQCSKLVSLSGTHKPASFEVGSHSTGHPSIHFARVTIMPLVISWSTGGDNRDE